MLPRYTWLLLFIPTLYVLYSSDYYPYLEKYIQNYYKETIRIFYGTESKEIKKNDENDILFTTSALKKYTNLKDGLYLAILGQVFDVTNGVKHYGPGETYHAFTGRDGSAAFITGDFTESGLKDDVSSLTNKQIQSLVNWVEFYRKTYTYKGKLIGRYYDEYGAPTNEKYKLEKRVEIAKKTDSSEEQIKLKFPPCNVEWDVNLGTRVWCSKNSGGIARDWIGVPRMLYDNPESKQYRCACIRLESKEFEENKGIIQAYEKCDENSTSCVVQSNDT